MTCAATWNSEALRVTVNDVIHHRQCGAHPGWQVELRNVSELCRQLACPGNYPMSRGILRTYRPGNSCSCGADPFRHDMARPDPT